MEKALENFLYASLRVLAPVHLALVLSAPGMALTT